MKKIKFLMIISLLFVSFIAKAQPMTGQEPPHVSGGMMGPTGIVTGTLFTTNEKKQKTILPNHSVTVIVYQDGQQVLTIDKKTDEKGVFVFKNIIQDPKFSFEFGTMHDNNIYVFPKLQLAKNEPTKTIEFEVGVNSLYKVDVPQQDGSAGMPPQDMMDGSMPPQQKPPHPVDPSWSKPYETYTVALVVFVLFLGAYFYFKGKE